MTSESALEAEELENVPLVRMEDVQPDRSVEYINELSRTDDELSQSDEIETCIVDGADYECVDDDDSNIGSMVSIQSEDVICEELIVPEVLDSAEDSELQAEEEKESPSPIQIVTKPIRPESWPTLEILPGGVINLGDKSEHNSEPLIMNQETLDSADMMYACAKCSESFKQLFSLVKHVRWHEQQARKEKETESLKLTPLDKKLTDLQKKGLEIGTNHKKNQIKVAVQDNIEDTKKSRMKVKYLQLPSGKRAVISKSKVKVLSKRS